MFIKTRTAKMVRPNYFHGNSNSSRKYFATLYGVLLRITHVYDWIMTCMFLLRFKKIISYACSRLDNRFYWTQSQIKTYGRGLTVYAGHKSINSFGYFVTYATTKPCANVMITVVVIYHKTVGHTLNPQHPNDTDLLQINYYNISRSRAGIFHVIDSRTASRVDN